MNLTFVIVLVQFFLVILNCADPNQIKNLLNDRNRIDSNQSNLKISDENILKIINISYSDEIKLSSKIDKLLYKLSSTQSACVHLKLVNIRNATKQLVSRSNVLYNIQVILRLQQAQNVICRLKLLEQITVGYQQLNINCGENVYQVTNGTPQMM